MGLPIGVSGFPDVVGQVGALVGETTGFTAAASAATAAAAAVTPPGNDADSVRAVTQQGATTANFIAALASGIAQLGARAADTAAVNTGFEAITSAGGAAVAAI